LWVNPGRQLSSFGLPSQDGGENLKNRSEKTEIKRKEKTKKNKQTKKKPNLFICFEPTHLWCQVWARAGDTGWGELGRGAALLWCEPLDLFLTPWLFVLMISGPFLFGCYLMPCCLYCFLILQVTTNWSLNLIKDLSEDWSYWSVTS